MKISDCVKESAAILSAAGIENPQLDAEVIIGHICALERYELKAYPEKEITAAQYAKIKTAIKRREKFEPVAYITGKKEFYAINLSVDSKTLIPRPETELLVDLAIYYIPMNGTALDLCTGSGAIAVALKHNRGDVSVTATDVSADALSVARKNAKNILGPKKITFFEGDLFAPVSGKKFDCIVSNPPYVNPDDKDNLAKDLFFEPPNALFANDNGREIVGKIIAQVKTYLNENGTAIIEIGETMGDFVKQAGKKVGFEVSVMNDYGGLPRVAVLKL